MFNVSKPNGAGPNTAARGPGGPDGSLGRPMRRTFSGHFLEMSEEQMVPRRDVGEDLEGGGRRALET